MPDWLTFSPRVVGRNRPDYHCVRSLLEFPAFKGKTGESLALALYDHFTSRQDGTYHFWAPDENAGTPSVRGAVCDPVKLLNAYGWAICGQSAAMMFELYRTAGLKARIFHAPGHVLAEVFYDERWHVFDIDMWTWFRTPDGYIAGAFELAANPQQLIVDNTDKSDPCCLPDRSLESYAGTYAGCERDGDDISVVAPDYGIAAHHMDFCLRPGETLIRSQKAEGRFPMPAAWLRSIDAHSKEWHGYPRERYAPFRSYGNGRWIYEPDLHAGYADVRAGLWEPTELRQTDAGLAGPGSAVIRIQSPYPFCGIPAIDGAHVKHRDGVWIEVSGHGVASIELTDAAGAWISVAEWSGDFNQRVDITNRMATRYEVFIRVNLARDAALSRFRYEGFILTAPMSLPRLQQGANPMQVLSGDAHGAGTTPWTRHIDFRDSADLLGQCEAHANAAVEPYVKGWQRITPAAQGPVRLIYRFDAPAGRPFAWLYAHASVNEAAPDAEAGQAILEFSLDGKHWHPLGAIDISATMFQWDCSIDGEVQLDNPAAAVWLRVSSATAVSGVEFHGHLQEDANASGILEITHQWCDDEGDKEMRAPAGRASYSIRCGPDPKDHTIVMRSK